jgi:hypothetical protein
VSETTPTPTDNVVELRVPGVSGTPPEELLGCPTEMLQQLSGDKVAGVYCCRPGSDTPGTGATSPEIEGYYWGGLTSGAATRALWLLFLPFVLIDLAHWMLPPSKTGRRAPAVAVTLLRLLGLAFTLTLMLASVEVVMDVVGWQCASVAHCAANLGPAKFLLNMPRGRQLMFTAIPVAVMPLALTVLGRPNPPAPIPPVSASAHADAQRNIAPPDAAVTIDRVPLAEPSFWNPDDSVKRLRSCHVMAWTSGLGAVTLAPPIQYLGHSGLRTACLALLWGQVGIVALSVAATAWTRLTGRGGATADRLTRPMWWMQWVSSTVLVATLAVVAFTKPAHGGGSPSAPTPMPGLRGTINGLLVAEILLLVAFFVFTARCMHGWGRAVKATLQVFRWPLRAMRRDSVTAATGTPAGFAPSLDGLAAPFVATIGLVVAGGFSAGVGLWAAELVGTPVRSTTAAACEIGFRAKVLGYGGSDVQALFDACDLKQRAQLPLLPADFETLIDKYSAATPIIVPPGYFAAAIVFSVLVLMLVVPVATLWLNYIPRWARAATGQVIEDYGGSPDREARDRALAVARARVLASLTDWIPPVLAGFAVTAIAAFVALVLVGLAGGFNRLPVWLPGLSTVCVAMLSAAAAGIVGLAVVALRDREKRRMVGVLWDVITFWPRANHPLTPPCYGERTVPELVGQLGYLVSGSRRLVLTGHSQGSIIAAATILQADNAGLPHSGLLTFGCPLRRLYAKNFPAYFGYNTVEAVHFREPTRWINLWALTDPIGSWLLLNDNHDMTDAPQKLDCRLLDVTSLDREARGDYPPICGHSGFWTRPEYHNAVSLLAGTLERRPHPDSPGTKM